MKKILILVLSADIAPYDKMITTSMNTWDSIDCEGTESIYYCGESDKPNTNKIIYLPVNESLHTMGQKLLLAFEWVLKNKDFDYIGRPHSCIYVDKKELRKYVDLLPATDVISGLQVIDNPNWLWGGCGFVLSRDVVEKIVANKELWNHTEMEDKGLSFIATKLGIPFTQGRGCSIDRKSDTVWSCTSYGTQGFDFENFEEMKKSGQYYIRCKQDGQREIDEYLMNELFKALNTK